MEERDRGQTSVMERVKHPANTAMVEATAVVVDGAGSRVVVDDGGDGVSRLSSSHFPLDLFSSIF